MRILTIAALAALSLNAYAVQYTPDTDVPFDIIHMHDTTTWKKVCESFDGVCVVPNGTYQVKLLDRNWNELHVIRNVQLHDVADTQAPTHSAVLTVEIDGAIGENDSCPTRKANKSYSTLQKALDCALNGDDIRVLKGVFDGVNVWDKNVTVVGRGQSQTYINGNSDVSAHVTLKRLTISSNRHTFDGGLLQTIERARLRLEDSVLTGGVSGMGGAMKIGIGTVVVIKNSVLTANEAENGGAIDNEGDLLVKRSIIAGNKASLGAGIYNRGGSLSVFSSLITGNNALSSGGGIFNDGGTVNFQNNPVVTLNTPTDCDGC